MKKYDAIVIGYGKAGKTISGFMGNKDMKVAIIEKSDEMYGGTCINIGCIPSKKLTVRAKASSKHKNSNFQEKAEFYKESIKEKRELVSKLRAKNFNMLNDNPNVDVYNGMASFVSKDVVSVKMKDETIEIQGDKIFINTGSDTVIPKIDGIDSKGIYTSTSIMELDELPETLVIVGGGYIGLEFASIYTGFGSKVKVLEAGPRITPREDLDVANEIKSIMEKRGVEFYLNSSVKSFEEKDGVVTVKYEENGELKEIKASAVLVAIGRRPNVKGLNLEAAGVELTERGAIKVNDKLETTQENIYALGDVNGGLQFTYVSLDDFRIVRDNLFLGKDRSTNDRKVVPYSVFIEPNLSSVGITETVAREKGYNIKVAKLPTMSIPRAHVIKETDGFLKAVVDADTNKILGATLICPESSEMINIIAMAMKADLDYTFIRDNIFTHPTMSEALNDLFTLIK